MADRYIKKTDLESDIVFDILVESNDLKSDDSLVTATMISIFTDASKPQIGTQIDGKIVGNPAYNINKLSTENIKAYEDGILSSLQWLIDDGVVLSVGVITEKDGNLLKVQITLTLDVDNDLNLIFSLDEKLEILD